MPDIRTCNACGQSDTDPKHQFVLDADHNSVFYHLDCHATGDPPCPICVLQLSEAGGAKGQKLREHLESLPVREY
jgi:hypothetical protein